jgi:TrmH family RNA methyltransferase
MPPITSRHNPLVARVRTAARGEASQVMLVDGIHLVGDAFAAGCRLREAAATTAAEGGELGNLIERLRGAGVTVSTVSSSVMRALSPLRSPSPIVALADRPTHQLADLFEDRTRPPLAIVAVGIQDPGNLGAIVRVAEAAGASGVIAATGSADPFGWKALRGAMGSAFRLPVAVCGEVAAAIDQARRHGCRVVATVPRGGRSLVEADLTGPVAVLIGGEGAGLPHGVLGEADELLTVPMAPPVESLNAAITAALVAYEARRQRTTGRSGERR